MNCFEARRALLTDPARLPGDVANHVSQCERCGRFAAQVRTLDMRVADAWSIGTPPGLGDRLKLSGPQRSRAWVPVMGGLALAASVLVAALVIGFPSAQGPGGIDWAASMVAHSEYDAAHELSADPDASQDFERVIQRLGGRIRAIPDGITRAGYCVLDGKAALHAVIEHAGERFVVYVLPGVAAQQTLVDLGGWHGEILSGDHSTIAVLGRGTTDAIEQLAQSLAASVQWSGSA